MSRAGAYDTSSSLLATIRKEIDVVAKGMHEALFVDLRGAFASVSLRLTTLTDIATSQCMSDTSTDTTGVTLPVSYVAMLDQMRTTKPAAYGVLRAAAETYASTPPLERRALLDKVYRELEAALVAV